jgi:hypothetical protein
MSDDLFEFLAAQEAGRAAGEARRAADEASVPPKCGQSSTRSKGSAACADSDVRACLTGRVRSGSRLYTTQLDVDFTL